MNPLIPVPTLIAESPPPRSKLRVVGAILILIVIVPCYALSWLPTVAIAALWRGLRDGWREGNKWLGGT